MKVLYVSSHYFGNGSGGALVSKNNYELLKDLNSVSEISVCDASGYLGRGVFRKIIIFIRAFFGFSSLLGVLNLYTLLRKPVFLEANTIWFDGSLYGPLISKIKNEYPRKKIIVFYHNIEFDFYREIYMNKSFLYKGLVRSAYKNEMLCSSLSDYVITLSKADGKRLEDVYGCESDYILPVFLCGAQELDSNYVMKDEINNKILFVGSKFPPNEEALRFLVDNVMPHLPNHFLTAVGKGLASIEGLQEIPNVEVIDYVEDLGAYYQGASLVVCPIFTGGGMKVKVAEALSYGKVIIATEFALVGYDFEELEDVVIADTAEDYIRLLNKKYPMKSDKNLLVFQKEYSKESQSSRLDVFFSLELSDE